eukprot:2842990-Amphidinium_carterae.1
MSLSTAETLQTSEGFDVDPCNKTTIVMDRTSNKSIVLDPTKLAATRRKAVVRLTKEALANQSQSEKSRKRRCPDLAKAQDRKRKSFRPCSLQGELRPPARIEALPHPGEGLRWPRSSIDNTINSRVRCLELFAGSCNLSKAMGGDIINRQGSLEVQLLWNPPFNVQRFQHAGSTGSRMVHNALGRQVRCEPAVIEGQNGNHPGAEEQANTVPAHGTAMQYVLQCPLSSDKDRHQV